MLEGMNVAERVDSFLKAAHMYANTSTGPDVMILMGNDFTYANAQVCGQLSTHHGATCGVFRSMQH